MANTAIKREKDKVSVRQFNCTNCGNALTMHNTRANYITCQYCGSQLDGNSDEHSVISAVGDPKRAPYKSFIRLGMIATFNNISYTVVARTSWRMDYKEWYSDSEGSGYSDEVWRYDEWLMASSKGTYHYLIDDKDGFYISQRFTPSKPCLPDRSLRMSLFKDRTPKQIQEIGSATVEHFEGESTYRVLKNDQVRFAMYKDGGKEYSVEYRLDRDNPDDITEIEFFKDWKVSNENIYKAFGNNEAVKELGEKRGKLKYLKNLFLAGTITMFCLMLYSFAASGAIQAEDSFSASDLQDEVPLDLGPWNLSDTKTLHSLSIECSSLPENVELWVGVEILENDEVIYAMDHVFSRWTGYDDGYYDEKDYTHSKSFKVDEAGEYTVKVYGDSDTDLSFFPTTVYLKVNNGGQSSLLYILFWLGFGITFLVFRTKFKRSSKG